MIAPGTCRCDRTDNAPFGSEGQRIREGSDGQVR